MLFTCLHIRRPRRLRHLRRLAATAPTAPQTLTRLPTTALTTPGALPVPGGTQPLTCTVRPIDGAAPDVEELRVRAWLHLSQHGRADTARPATGAGR